MRAPVRPLLVAFLAAAALVAATPAWAEWGYLGQWGSPGSADGQFQDPAGIGLANGEVVVADRQNDRIQRFSPTGSFLGTFGTPGTGNAQFAFPQDVVGVAPGSPGAIDLLVADFGNDRVQRLSFTGVWRESWTTVVGSPSTLDGPDGVAVAGATAYVADGLRNRIARYDAETGAAQTPVGGPGAAPGQFAAPARLAVDLQGNLLVADRDNDRVQKLAPSGAHLLTIGSSGSGPGQLRQPEGVAVDLQGNVWVADTGNDRIQKFSPTGAWIGSFGNEGSGNGQFQAPSDVAVSLDGTVYVADSLNNRIQYFGEGGTPPPGSAGGGGGGTGPDPGGSTGCSRVGHTVGAVGVCADALTSTGIGTWQASGDVRLNLGVAVSGPVTIDDGSRLITSGPGTTIAVDRPGGAVVWGTGRIEIDANPATDPVSGRGGLARISVTDFTRSLQTTIGGLTMGFLGSSDEYLDAADGGGLILSVRPSFDLIGLLKDTAPSGSLALGVHSGTGSAIRVLGGSLGWNGIELGGGWKLGTLELAYQEAGSVWSLTGGAEFPFVASVGGIEVTGSIVAGRLDALSVRLKTRGVPLGQTGIVLDTFGGSLKGLATGPLVVEALTGGGWTPTQLPAPFDWILHIKDVTLTLDTSGAGGLKGGVAVLDGEGRLAGGSADLTVRLLPAFLATGSLSVHLDAVAVGVDFTTQAAMDARHFTATGTVKGELVGLTVGSASGILSDTGAGATVRVCVPFFGCTSLGYGLSWRSVTSFPPDLVWIGGDLERYRTVASAGAPAAARSFVVEPGRPLLVVSARGEGDASGFELVSPRGVRYAPDATRPDLYVDVRPDEGVTALVVYGPAAGRWRLEPASPGAASYAIQEVAPLGRVVAKRLAPAGTVKQPLRRGRVKTVAARWASTGLAASARVDLYVTRSPKAAGTLVKRGLRRSGSYRIPLRRFPAGKSYVRLVVRSGPVPFQTVVFARPVRVASR